MFKLIENCSLAYKRYRIDSRIPIIRNLNSPTLGMTHINYGTMNRIQSDEGGFIFKSTKYDDYCLYLWIAVNNRHNTVTIDSHVFTGN